MKAVQDFQGAIEAAVLGIMADLDIFDFDQARVLHAENDPGLSV